MSDNLNLPVMVENQTAKEVTFNDALAIVDAVLTETFVADLTSGNVVLTSDQFRQQARVKLANATTGGRTATVPAIKRGFIVTADPANTANVALVCGSTSVAISPGEARLCFTDGTTNGLTTYAIGSTFDAGVFLPGLMVDNQIALVYPVTRGFTLPIALAGSGFNAVTAPTDGAAVLTINKNGSSVGSLSWAIAGHTPTVTFTSAVSFAAGDLLTITGPATADGAFANIGINLKGTR